MDETKPKRIIKVKAKPKSSEAAPLSNSSETFSKTIDSTRNDNAGLESHPNLLQGMVTDLGIQAHQIIKTIELLSEGNTIPFIARYRKEATGTLDEVAIQNIRDRYEYLKELTERKAYILKTIDQQEKLTPELESKIQDCMVKQDLEDLFLPYKPKRRTKATIAREAGLEPLAEIIRTQQLSYGDPMELAKDYINPEAKVDTPKKALEGASFILAEELAEQADVRKHIRKLTFDQGIILTQVTKAYKEQPSKFEQYYDYKEPVKEIPPHRFLAIRRAVQEEVITASITVDIETIEPILERKVIRNKNSIFVSILRAMYKDAYTRLLAPAIETDIWTELKSKADDASIQVFSKNLRDLLLQPPGGNKWVMGIDPGFRTGSKIAIIDETGKFITHETIFPVPPQNKAEQAAQTVIQLIKKYPIEIISIGNGTASRELDAFVTEVLRNNKDVIGTNRTLEKYVVNESGASIYSASEIARKEFPSLDVSIRGAISIARRIQDPLAELVKIDPKSIGVGQYQHDVNQPLLKKSLQETVESCVNFVGVELNTASESLLSYVAGIGPRVAGQIVEHRNSQGRFTDRQSLMEVSGFGPKAFQQAAGFLRIRESSNPLDASAVHPERYEVVNQMISDINQPLERVMGQPSIIETIQIKKYVSDDVGIPTLEDIITELKKPGRDPREGKLGPQFDDRIMSIEDLKPNMVLEGTVTNITHFGAFVDIGVHQDGLVHISELADRFVKDPMEVCQVHQIVRVKVLDVDVVRKRIQLSMKQA
jgi:protein Tex